MQCCMVMHLYLGGLIENKHKCLAAESGVKRFRIKKTAQSSNCNIPLPFEER